jgi:membrane protease YdiL (CAAX protease family)
LKDDFYFENENAENIPPISFEKGNDVEIDFSEISQNNVENSNNVINNQNSFNNAEKTQSYNNFQPNYYGYQQSYQPIYGAQFLNNENIKRYYEKKAVNKTANSIGLGLVIFFAFSLIFSFALTPFLMNKEIADFISNPAITLELNIILSVLGFGLAGFIILKSQKLRASEIISYSPPKKDGFWESILVAVGFCYTANIVVSMLQARFESILPFNQPELELPTGGLGFLISVIAVAIAPAMIEEFLFRAVIMGSLLKFGKGFAIFTSAFLFGLVHGNLIQIPFAFLVGLVIGAVVVETNSIWTGVIVHFINNFLSVCMDYLGDVVDKDILNVSYLFLIAFLIIIGFFAFYLLNIKNKNLFNFEKSKDISTSMQKFGWFSSSVLVIVYFVVVFLEILSVQITA